MDDLYRNKSNSDANNSDAAPTALFHNTDHSLTSTTNDEEEKQRDTCIVDKDSIMPEDIQFFVKEQQGEDDEHHKIFSLSASKTYFLTVSKHPV